MFFTYFRRASVLYSSVGMIYLAAFVSLYVQYPGLLGHNGILPADSFLSRVMFESDKSFFDFPSLLFYASRWGIPVDCMSDFLLLWGSSSSLLLIGGMTHPFLLLSCWLSYLSVFLVGQTFLSFQWDILLLEVGFLCVLTSSLQWVTGSVCSKQGSLVWGYRFLLFKLMLMSGATKLQAGCPTWDKLTALEYHFATQPLPSALAWFSHQLPPLLLRLGVAATLLIELPATLLLVCPNHIWRLWGAVLQGLLQLMIMATGNYNFFNLLTLVLLIPVCERDDDDLPVSLSESPSSSPPPPSEPAISPLSKVTVDARGRRKTVTMSIYTEGFWGFGVQSCLVYVFLAVSCWVMFDVQFLSPGSEANSSSSSDNSSGQDHDAYGDWLSRVQVQVRPDFHLQSYLTPGSVMGFALSFGGVLYSTLRKGKIFPKTQMLSFLVLGLYLQLSFTTFASIGVNVKDIYTTPTLQYTGFFSEAQYSRLQGFVTHRHVRDLRLWSSYGLFRRMTGMGTAQAGGGQTGVGGMPPSVVARPEILLEGLNEETGVWHPIQFRYKPGDVHAMPSFVVPHQPRLDWQMWFAALGSYSHNPWLVHFMFKLLAGHCPEVIALIDSDLFYHAFSPTSSSNSSTTAAAPVALRATLVQYDFTRYDSPWARGLYPHHAGDASSDDASSDDASSKSDSENGSRKTSPYVQHGGSTQRGVHVGDGAWWYQQPGSSQAYLPLVLDKHNPSVHNFLQAHGLSSQPDGKAQYLSALSLQSQCRATTPAFLASPEVGTTPHTWAGWVLSVAIMPLRGLVCDAIAVRSTASTNLHPATEHGTTTTTTGTTAAGAAAGGGAGFASAGFMQAGMTLSIVVLTIIVAVNKP